MDTKQLITNLTINQTKLRKELKDLSNRKLELTDQSYETAVESDVLKTQIGDIRSEMMQNRLGDQGLRCLNKELANTRERRGW